MPNLTQEFGTATQVRATGYTAVTSANSAIIGIMFHGTGTGIASFYLTAAASGSVTVGGPIRAYVTVGGATVNTAVYYDFPAYCSGGFSVNLAASADPNVTIFWNPVGG